MSEQQAHPYNSNPFRTVMAQLVMLLNTNPISSLTLGLVMLVVIIGGFLLIGLISGLIGGSAGAIIGFLLGIAFTVVAVLRFAAATVYLQVASREGRSVTAVAAINEAAKRNYSKFVLASLATGLLVLIGLVLLIVPGLYLVGRITLAPIIAMVEGLGVQASLKRSWELTEGHWFEVFAANIASAIVTPNGLLSMAGGEAGPAGRYFELVELKKSGAAKPETHWMNYLLTGIAVVGAMIYGIVIKSSFNTGRSSSGDICGTSTYRNSILCDTKSNDTFRSNDNLDNFFDSSPSN
jgi:hypothetical protein